MAHDLQRASMWKRISAWLLDAIMLVVLITGFAWMMSAILRYDKYSNAYDDVMSEYEEKYGTSFDYTREEYDALSEEDRAIYDKAFQEFSTDETAVYNFQMVVNLTIIVLTVSTLLAFAILELAVPLAMGNGQTIGKKVFSLAVMRTDGVRLTPFQLVVRTFLGKFTIETMIPMLIIIMMFFRFVGLGGTLMLLGLFALNVGLMIGTRTNSCIHDVFAVTCVVNMASQMIFDTEDDLIRYKEQVAAEKARSSTY